MWGGRMDQKLGYASIITSALYYIILQNRWNMATILYLLYKIKGHETDQSVVDNTLCSSNMQSKEKKQFFLGDLSTVSGSR